MGPFVSRHDWRDRLLSLLPTHSVAAADQGCLATPGASPLISDRLIPDRSRRVVGISTTQAGGTRTTESQFPILSEKHAIECVGHFPLLSCLRCNATPSLLRARYPAASHAAGQMASRCNLLRAVCSVSWMRDSGKEKSSVKFSLHSASFPSLKAGGRIITPGEVWRGLFFLRQRSVDRCADKQTFT